MAVKAGHFCHKWGKVLKTNKQDVVLLMNVENTMKRTYEKWRSYKNKHYKEIACDNRKATTYIQAKHNEERRFGEFDTRDSMKAREAM